MFLHVFFRLIFSVVYNNAPIPLVRISHSQKQNLKQAEMELPVFTKVGKITNGLCLRSTTLLRELRA